MKNSVSLALRQRDAISNGVASKNIYVARAANAELWDVDGKRYLDFASGIAVTNTGHRHPKVMAAVAAQAEAFAHTCFHVAPYETYIALAERLNAIAPVVGEAKTLFLSTGAEAVENAIKIARVATGRSAVIAFVNGFHGRTMMGMALTGKVMPYKRGFGPFPAEIYHAPFPNALAGVSIEQALAGLNNILTSDVDAQRVAAIIIEPVQGEGGFVPAPPAFLAALRALADKHGIVLIADEVQTGIARTGRLFAMEHSGVEADLVTVAKGLGGGFPISAVTGRADLMDAAHAGGLGGTFGGNPISIAAAHAVLDVVDEESLCARAEMIGEVISTHLRQIKMPEIAEIRGIGAMIAFELAGPGPEYRPLPQLAAEIVADAQDHGLILLLCGPAQNVVRLLPPLTIPDDHLAEALDILESSLQAAIYKHRASA